MINSVGITNFKSIKELNLDFKKVNIFIGEPNTGKSNILEAFGLISCHYYDLTNIKSFVRFTDFKDIFFNQDNDLTTSININNDILCSVKYLQDLFRVSFAYKNSREYKHFNYDLDGKHVGGGSSDSFNDKLELIKFYRFNNNVDIEKEQGKSLVPPSGSNLLNVIYNDKKIIQFIKNILEKYDLSLTFQKIPKKMFFQRNLGDYISQFSYDLLSDGLKNLIFHFSAILSNNNATLIFEEPESHTFPYYTKFLAEQIALDSTNQFIMATHNPYFLNSLIEKVKKNDLSIFLTFHKNQTTKVRLINEDEMRDLFSLNEDLFFNLDQFIEE